MKIQKIGIFGLWRGGSFISIINSMTDAHIVAICDSDEEKLKSAAKECKDNVACFTDFDEMLKSGIDCVFLCNYFHEHAKYAVKAFEVGVAVFSECTSAATLGECVQLCDAYEKYNGRYMIAENYPFTAANLEIENMCNGGTFGRILYAEGEYNHTGPREMLASLTPEKYHWRAWLPRTYYVTHALGPLMYASKQMPVKVSAFAVHSDVLQEYDDFRHNYDAFAMMSCMTDGGALFRFTGCAAMASPSGYRVVGEYGSAETGRTLGGNVNVTYHNWCVPEGKNSSQTYAPDFPEEYRAAVNAGHGGGDYITIRKFLDYVQGGEEPFFNIYRGVCMSEVAIFGWRSCLNNGQTYDIPDFRNKDERAKYADDFLTPFPDKDGNVTLPCHT